MAFLTAPSRLTLKASGNESISTTGAQVPWGGADYGDSLILVTVDVTAIAGSPSLAVVIEGSANQGMIDGGWYELGRIGSDGWRVGWQDLAPTDLTGVDNRR